MQDTYLTRETLLKRLKSVDDDLAWEEFSFYYSRFIYSILVKSGVKQEDRDDLVQQVMLKVWKSLPNFDYDQKRGGFRNWLFIVSRNTAYNFLARDKRYTSTEEIEQLPVDGAVSPEIEEVIEDEWKRYISSLAFENVSKSCSPLSMDIFASSAEGETLGQIAKRLDMKENTVCRYKNRVKEKLIAEIKSLREMLE